MTSGTNFLSKIMDNASADLVFPNISKRNSTHVFEKSLDIPFALVQVIFSYVGDLQDWVSVFSLLKINTKNKNILAAHKLQFLKMEPKPSFTSTQTLLNHIFDEMYNPASFSEKDKIIKSALKCQKVHQKPALFSIMPSNVKYKLPEFFLDPSYNSVSIKCLSAVFLAFVSLSLVFLVDQYIDSSPEKRLETLPMFLLCMFGVAFLTYKCGFESMEDLLALNLRPTVTTSSRKVVNYLGSQNYYQNEGRNKAKEIFCQILER